MRVVGWVNVGGSQVGSGWINKVAVGSERCGSSQSGQCRGGRVGVIGGWLSLVDVGQSVGVIQGQSVKSIWRQSVGAIWGWSGQIGTGEVSWGDVGAVRPGLMRGRV